jgi:DNA-binding NarL/FixJ family response regulator
VIKENFQPPGSGRNILVVDTDTLEKIALHLGLRRDQITVAGTGGGALGLLDHCPFDLVIIGPAVTDIPPDELISDIQHLFPLQRVLTLTEFVRRQAA